ncbi:hypothetical protein C6P46_001186 [Rhodotorula mucilaginosa]|uniref:Uncharacterized protein n=1 Tax=Rhodotorula mucilaginosa TaxID=5537 RepID=A0A9P6W5T7_RHOMI|nr:hypothetical protein C6P46_001186 [Rhodotorula mucilaginosa]
MDEALGWGIAAGVCYFAYKLVFEPGANRFFVSRPRFVDTSSPSLAGFHRPDHDHVPERIAKRSAVGTRTERGQLAASSSAKRLPPRGRSAADQASDFEPHLGCPQPPASYFPPSADTSPAANPFPTTPARATTAAAPTTPVNAASSANNSRGSAPPSLIARMGLQAQVAADVKGKGKAAEEGSASASGWSPKAEERERNLRARKERLVLEARRKLLEKEAWRRAEAGEAEETS